MERQLGNELMNAFGARLRRTFEADASLPDPMAQALERLREAERDAAPKRPQPAPQSSYSDHRKRRHGTIFSRFLPIGET